MTLDWRIETVEGRVEITGASIVLSCQEEDAFSLTKALIKSGYAPDDCDCQWSYEPPSYPQLPEGQFYDTNHSFVLNEITGEVTAIQSWYKLPLGSVAMRFPGAKIENIQIFVSESEDGSPRRGYVMQRNQYREGKTS